MTHAKHVLPFRRKREGKTNYKKRLALLKSGQPRLIIRRSNRHILLQLVRYEADGDKVVAAFNSKSLAKHGWTHATKSVPAAYLSGVLLAKTAVEKGTGQAIVDLGLQKHRAGTRLCAAIKGAIDGGLAIPASADIFPAAERLAGRHISDAVAKDVASLASKLGVTLPAETPKKSKTNSKTNQKTNKKAPEQKAAKPAAAPKQQNDKGAKPAKQQTAGGAPAESAEPGAPTTEED